MWSILNNIWRHKQLVHTAYSCIFVPVRQLRDAKSLYSTSSVTFTTLSIALSFFFFFCMLAMVRGMFVTGQCQMWLIVHWFMFKQDWIALVKAASAAAKNKGGNRPRTSANSNKDREDRREQRSDEELDDDDESESEKLGMWFFRTWIWIWPINFLMLYGEVLAYRSVFSYTVRSINIGTSTQF